MFSIACYVAVKIFYAKLGTNDEDFGRACRIIVMELLDSRHEGLQSRESGPGSLVNNFV